MSRLPLAATAALGAALIAAGPASAASPSLHAPLKLGGTPLLGGSPLKVGTPGGQIAQIHHATPHGQVTQGTSPHWAGYAADGDGPYHSVSSSWTQPGANCDATPDAAASFWVGLDGKGTDTVEQTGTTAECDGGSPSYYGWYEMYPDAPISYPGPVAPGDQMSASVNTDGNGNFQLTLADNTQGWTKTTNESGQNYQLGSAEVIAEAPQASDGSTVPLTDFGSVQFGASSVDGQSLASTPGLEPITLVGDDGTTKAQPGGIANDGDFGVNWENQ
ncbi:MAG: hypothetical protein J2O48_02015 [Solirubrobacterales bacterium]|nr:hypothetical protein [Solirubrobacterales bacterium]